MYDELKGKVTSVLSSKEEDVTIKLRKICVLLKENISYYDWVGFYFNNGEKPELKLRTYAGEHTDHVIIPFGKGICGQVAVSNANFVVPDVMAQDNYLACSLDVKAEIVVPIFVNGKNIGQIDIDSKRVNPFVPEDELFLEFIAAEVAKVL